jgi:carboxymethylenebutenolidase
MVHQLLRVARSTKGKAGDMIARRACLVLLLCIFPAATAVPATDSLPTRVEFPSLDGHTALVGYLFEPRQGQAPFPAVVMMHGRAGAYSSQADGQYDASRLSQRHAFWGHFWADHGYAALLVDGFGPRGYPHGFPAHSYEERPDVLNEVTVRPLDAYGALKYLRSLAPIDGSRILLQGWSNGGSATIASMSHETLASIGLGPAMGFRGAVAFYPACGLHGQFNTGFRPYAPLRIFAGSADEEVSAAHCARLVQNAAPGSDVAIKIYDGATHDFDDPGRKRQSVPQNVSAASQAIPATLTFAEGLVRPR